LRTRPLYANTSQSNDNASYSEFKFNVLCKSITSKSIQSDMNYIFKNTYLQAVEPEWSVSEGNREKA